MKAGKNHHKETSKAIKSSRVKGRPGRKRPQAAPGGATSWRRHWAGHRTLLNLGASSPHCFVKLGVQCRRVEGHFPMSGMAPRDRGAISFAMVEPRVPAWSHLPRNRGSGQATSGTSK